LRARTAMGAESVDFLGMLRQHCQINSFDCCINGLTILLSFLIFMTSTRGAITGPVRLVVAARQGWRCSDCSQLLSSAFEVDHTVALVDGGEDAVSNATAMCANCHARKTQREHIARHNASSTRADEYEDREDTYQNNTITCQRCRRNRPLGTPHPVCWAIETSPCGVANALARFAWVSPLEARLARR